MADLKQLPKGSLIFISFDKRTALKKLNLLRRTIPKESGIVLDSYMAFGNRFARTVAPFQSGRLARFIQTQTPKGNKDNIVGKIIAKNPTLNPPSNYRLYTSSAYPSGKFNLVRWMHQTRGVHQSPNPFNRHGGNHIRSGDPRFMYSTSSAMRMVTNKFFKGAIDKAKITAGYRRVIARA